MKLLWQLFLMNLRNVSIPKIYRAKRALEAKGYKASLSDIEATYMASGLGGPTFDQFIQGVKQLDSIENRWDHDLVVAYHFMGKLCDFHRLEDIKNFEAEKENFRLNKMKTVGADGCNEEAVFKAFNDAIRLKGVGVDPVPLSKLSIFNQIGPKERLYIQHFLGKYIFLDV